MRCAGRDAGEHFAHLRGAGEGVLVEVEAQRVAAAERRMILLHGLHARAGRAASGAYARCLLSAHGIAGSRPCASRVRMASAWPARPSASASSAAWGPSTRSALRSILLHGDELDEVVDAQAAAHARHAAGGQRVIGARDVIAHGLRRPAAHEDRTRICDPVEIARLNRR